MSLSVRVIVPSALVLAALGCTCTEARSERAPRRELGSEGGDLGLLEPFADPSMAPAPERFEPIDPTLGEGAARARSWAGAAALRGPSDRDDPGNFLCRLWAHWGAPRAPTDEGFRYVLRDTELHQIVVAVLDARGPSFAVLGEGPDDERRARSADELARTLDATRPIDCTLRLGERTIGVRGERSLR